MIPEGIVARNEHMVMPDGARLFVRELCWGIPRTQVLVFGHLGESIIDPANDALMRSIMHENMLVRMVELRAHTLSQGFWSLGAYRRDITHVIAQSSASGLPLYIIAWGLSASTMLEYDDQAHTIRGMMPPLPRGMLLLDPLFAGVDILPKSRVHKFAHRISRKISQAVLLRLLRTKEGLGFGRCRLQKETLARFWVEMSSYALYPVRVQTPSMVLVPIDEHADPLKRIFGTATIRRVGWLHHLRAGNLSSAQAALHVQELRDAFETILKADAPIRFRVERR